MPALRLLAPAKVNLTLEVLGRPPDGSHEVRTVMQTIDLCDDLSFAPAEGVSVECESLDVAAEEELSYRAAVLLRQASGTDQGAAIKVFTRMGFQREARLRNQVMDRDSVLHDLQIMSLDVDEFQAKIDVMMLSAQSEFMGI